MTESDRNQLIFELTSAEQLFDRVKNHPIMSVAAASKVQSLKDELAVLESAPPEPRAVIYFFGSPVRGSVGVEALFLSETINPFQQMVSSRVANRSKNVARKGKIKNVERTKLYLTSLPRGSFGIELKKLDSHDLFDAEEVTSSIAEVVQLIDSSHNFERFSSVAPNASARELSALKKFFAVLSKNGAGIVVESNQLKSQFTPSEALAAFDVISQVVVDVNEIEIIGKFTGIFLASKTFEFVTSTDEKITGALDENLSEEDLAILASEFLDRSCVGTFIKTTTNQVEGEGKSQYKLVMLSDHVT